jgi:SAM-dependent methyltransferase
MFIGRELAYHPEYSLMQRVYIRLLGVPIVGLRIRARNIFSLIPRNRSYREILDAGCGLGVFSFYLATCFPQANVVGVDLSLSAVRSAEYIHKKAGIPNVRFHAADITNVKWEDRFDLAVCVDILEHIEDDDAALVALYRSLRNEGVLVLHVPALYRRYPVWKKSLNFDVETHVRTGYELQGILQKVQRVGFSILESGYTYGFLETLANNASYLISRARMQNKFLYAVAFPFLNILSWFGARSRPKELGAGIYVVAGRGKSDDL